jgi:hypothetical protein
MRVCQNPGSTADFLSSLPEEILFFGQRKRAMNLRQIPMSVRDRVANLRILPDAAQFRSRPGLPYLLISAEDTGKLPDFLAGDLDRILKNPGEIDIAMRPSAQAVGRTPRIPITDFRIS